MAERFSGNISPNILNISHARSETEKLLRENESILGKEMIDAMTLIENNSDFFTSVIRYGISNSHSQGTFFSPDLADTLLNCHAPKPVMTFAGRDTEAKEVYKMLSKDSVLFVSGIAGIGKSEFVKYFAEKYAKELLITIIIIKLIAGSSFKIYQHYLLVLLRQSETEYHRDGFYF